MGEKLENVGVAAFILLILAAAFFLVSLGVHYFAEDAAHAPAPSVSQTCTGTLLEQLQNNHLCPYKENR